MREFERSRPIKKYPLMQWTSERVSNFWDYESQFPENYFTFQVGGKLVDRVASFLPETGAILDYGCGAGFLIRHLLDRGYQVTGLDFSRQSIEETNSKFQKEKSYGGAFLAEEILAKGLKFAAIFLIEVIEHLDDEYLSLTMRNLKSLLAPNGVIIISTPNQERLEDQHIFCPQCEHVFHRWQHLRSWSESGLNGFLEKSGFRISGSFVTNLSAPPPKRSLLRLLKQGVKRTLGMPPTPKGPSPHLISICT